MSKDIHVVPKIYAMNRLEFEELRKRVGADYMARHFDVYLFKQDCKKKGINPTLHRYEKWIDKKVEMCSQGTYEQEIEELTAEYAKYHMEVV